MSTVYDVYGINIYDIDIDMDDILNVYNYKDDFWFKLHYARIVDKVEWLDRIFKRSRNIADAQESVYGFAKYNLYGLNTSEEKRAEEKKIKKFAEAEAEALINIHTTTDRVKQDNIARMLIKANDIIKLMADRLNERAAAAAAVVAEVDDFMKEEQIETDAARAAAAAEAAVAVAVVDAFMKEEEEREKTDEELAWRVHEELNGPRPRHRGAINSQRRGGKSRKQKSRKQKYRK